VTVDDLIAQHLDAAHNLARWLVPSPPDAQDVLQDACLRAVMFFDQYRGGDAKAWLLAIVRNACRDWHRRSRRAAPKEDFDEQTHSGTVPSASPESLAIAASERERVRLAIEDLPSDMREVLVLREIEGLSYKDIAAVVEVPIGTVMSRLARARGRRSVLLDEPKGAARDVR
jgi:RNA polymerase sigma-70 factor (ECF subfamily)